ncbi:MAG: hypothetical protein ACI8V8_002486 [Chitinophagales bacterium]|jgi:hypothetical protein
MKRDKEDNEISTKKPSYRIGPELTNYLKKYLRYTELEITYESLLRFQDSFPVYDKDDNDTFWRLSMYAPEEQEEIQKALLEIYLRLTGDLDHSAMDHLKIDRIDYCLFGNSKPFRIQVKNLINDNYDYYYIKQADSSRIYGLELEQLISPNKVNYLVNESTLVEEHIIGIPGDQFLKENLKDKKHNWVRLAKEFVKFNERCLVRLLGDMRSYNFIIDMTPDFDQMQYRVRAIDFDQQNFEGKLNIYTPQFFKENRPFVKMVSELLTRESILQYQNEERSLIRRRISVSESQLKELLICMQKEVLSLQEKVERLGSDLAEFHKDDSFRDAKRMSDILLKHLNTRLKMNIET